MLFAYIVSEDIAAVAFTMKDMNTDVMNMLKNISTHTVYRKTEIYF